MINVCFPLLLGIPGFHQGSILSISFRFLFLNSSAAIKQCLKEARDTHGFSSSFPCLFSFFLFLHDRQPFDHVYCPSFRDLPLFSLLYPFLFLSTYLLELIIPSCPKIFFRLSSLIGSTIGLQTCYTF